MQGTEKDKITYLNELSVCYNGILKGVPLILAYEGYKKGLTIQECILYITDNKEQRERELEEQKQMDIHKKEQNNKSKLKCFLLRLWKKH